MRPFSLTCRTLVTSVSLLATAGCVAKDLAGPDMARGKSATPVGLAVRIRTKLQTVTIGQRLQLEAILVDTVTSSEREGSVTWWSTDPHVVSVSTGGMMTAMGGGGAMVVASTSNGKSDTVKVRVDAPVVAVVVTPSQGTVAVGQSAQLTAAVLGPSKAALDGHVVAWASTNPAVATVSDSGLVSGVARGSTSVVATADGKSATVPITVVPTPVASLVVSPTQGSVLTGDTLRLVATATDSNGTPLADRPVAWVSSNSSVASVTAEGVAKGVGPGSATLSATVEGETAAATLSVTLAPVASVVVSAPDSTLTVGQTSALSAVLTDENGNTLDGRPVTWTSSNAGVATVSGNGVATAVSAGSATITATSEGKSGSLALSVASAAVASVSVALGSSTLSVGQTTQATATFKDASGQTLSGLTASWMSSNSAVASVSPTGVVTALTAGTAAITATSESKSGSASVSVTAPTTAPTPTPVPVTGSPAELPRVFLDTRYVAPSGRTISVAAGGDLQAALNAALPGDAIELAPGASYVGEFVLPAKAAGPAVVLRTAGTLPPEGVRVSPASAAGFAKILSPTVAPALRTAAGAHDWRIMAVEISATAAATTSYGLVFFGDGSSAQNSLSTVPRGLVLDRAYVHGTAGLDVRRCVALNSATTAVIDSYLSECHSKGFDAQAIGGHNGPGPFKIVNNYLEGSTENIAFGGSDPAIAGLVPSDIEIRRNHFYKPLSWKGVWLAKNLLEIKSGQRMLIEGNVMENSWADGQVGFAVLLWSVNQGGNCNWCVTQDVTFQYNRISNTGGGFNLVDKFWATSVTTPMRRVLIANNVMYNVGASTMGGTGHTFQLSANASGVDDLTIAHNSGGGPSSYVIFSSGANGQHDRLVVRDNVAPISAYPFFGGGVGAGQIAFDKFAAGAVVRRNVIAAGTSQNYPPDNRYPTTTAGVGFANYPYDASLTATSPAQSYATDGTDSGADLTGLAQHLQGVVKP